MSNLFFPFLIFLLLSCREETEKTYKELEVTASAYNSVAWQTKANNPSIAAWGDTLKPEMKAIAVSRDLIDSGLVHNTKVIIEGFQDTFLVKDKMNRRWRKKIDIYMGLDITKARDWGKKEVTIRWAEKDQSASLE